MHVHSGEARGPIVTCGPSETTIRSVSMGQDAYSGRLHCTSSGEAQVSITMCGPVNKDPLTLYGPLYTAEQLYGTYKAVKPEVRS